MASTERRKFTEGHGQLRTSQVMLQFVLPGRLYVAAESTVKDYCLFQ
jgi:hypothetical protein